MMHPFALGIAFTVGLLWAAWVTAKLVIEK